MALFLRRALLARISVFGGKPDVLNHEHDGNVLNQRARREKMTQTDIVADTAAFGGR